MFVFLVYKMYFIFFQNIKQKMGFKSEKITFFIIRFVMPMGFFSILLQYLFLIISLEIGPLAALYLPPPYKKCALQGSALGGRKRWYPHAYGICALFYCISLKNIYEGGGYNAARALISRDIAHHLLNMDKTGKKGNILEIIFVQIKGYFSQ